MLSIFISHDWNESEKYNNFEKLLNSVLGVDAWNNLSIPRSQAIELRGWENAQLEASLDHFEEKIIHLQAALQDPGLSRALYRVSWDERGNKRELDCVGSIEERLAHTYHEREELIGESGERYEMPPEFRDRKGASHRIRLDPELSLIIRRRIVNADIVFILITPFCRMRRWIDFEIAVCAGTSARVIGVEAGGYSTLDFRIDCHKVVSWSREGIRASIHDRLT